MSEINIDLDTTVKNDRAKIKSILDLLVMMGDSIKSLIPGTLDDKIVDILRFGSNKKDVIEFIGRIADLFGQLDTNEIEEVLKKAREINA